MFNPKELFDLGQTEHAALFEGCGFAWQVLARIGDYLGRHLKPGLHNKCQGIAYIGEHVYIGPGTIVEDGAMIRGPAIIGRNCQIRHNAYIRENVIIGDDCTVGNACEVKNSLLFNRATVPHFNYVGDSVLGHGAHLGAGVVLSNVKALGGNVMVVSKEERYDSGLSKFGALIGDHAEIGCNSVLNPGSIIGRRSVIQPCTNWRGVLPEDMIAKNRSSVELVIRRNLDDR
ncbi:MAG: DapH/DapD/GlmU-related protein [Verrucomicrobia bacterium]|jgi:NDP-sugar pyrophosphorylase family protein|nr:DapH/DapD/GlmU-related protein [Verrucomicrobiota bacterium]